MKVYLVLTILILPVSFAQAYTLKFELKGIFNSKKLTAKDANGSTGSLVSNRAFDPAINITYGLSKTWNIFLESYNRTLSFDNTDNIISGDTDFTSNMTQLGVQWILGASMAFRFLYTSEKEYGFTLNGSNQAVLFEESIAYPTLIYDQILYMGQGYYFGLNLGYDISASAADIKNRGGTRFGFFMNYGSFNFFYELRNITKETDDWEYEDQDTFFGLSYVLAY